MTDDLVIRPAIEDDAAGLFDLRERVAAEGVWIGSEAPLDPARERGLFRSLVDSEDKALFIALIGDDIVGGLGIAFGLPGVTEFGMQIDRAWRHRGIGSALLTEAIAWSTERGAHKLELQVWPHNGPAIGLYEKFGFVREGCLRRHYRRRSGELWDAVVMGLVLDTASPGSELNGPRYV